jgi:hypothetical protein
MSKPRGDPACGISSEDVLILTEWHPACRQREARSGSGTERENLTDDAKGKGTSGSRREVPMCRRGADCRIVATKSLKCGWSEGAGSSPLGPVNRQRDEPDIQRKAAAFVRWHDPDKSRGLCPDPRETRGETPGVYSAKARLGSGLF